MSVDDRDNDHFLARWSRRKDEIARTERDAAKDTDTVEGVAGETAQAGETAETEKPELPFDLDLLPKLQDITGDTDISLFMNKAVPDDMRNAALRRVWHLNEAIRDYVDPAMEYAWDWNTPGMSPGEALEAGYDTAKQIAGMLSSPQDDTLVEGKITGAETGASPGASETLPANGPATSENAALQQVTDAPAESAPPLQSVRRDDERLSNPRERADIDLRDAERDETAAKSQSRDLSAEVALQHGRRRHGGATPV